MPSLDLTLSNAMDELAAIKQSNACLRGSLEDGMARLRLTPERLHVLYHGATPQARMQALQQVSALVARAAPPELVGDNLSALRVAACMAEIHFPWPTPDHQSSLGPSIRMDKWLHGVV